MHMHNMYNMHMHMHMHMHMCMHMSLTPISSQSLTVLFIHASFTGGAARAARARQPARRSVQACRRGRTARRVVLHTTRERRCTRAPLVHTTAGVRTQVLSRHGPPPPPGSKA